jgi:hypothetical protein
MNADVRFEAKGAFFYTPHQKNNLSKRTQAFLAGM